MSAFNILLHKYTGNNDLIVGIPTYRSPANLPCVLPLRLNISNKSTVKDFLWQVKKNVINAYTHQDYSFDELLDLLAIPQAQNRCSLYDIVVLLENIHNCAANLNNDITVSFSVNNSVIAGKIIYNQSLFKDEAIAIFINHYLNVIESAIKNIDTEISRIVLFKEEERDLLLRGFNDNTKAYPVDKTIHSLFAEQAKRTPNDLAVVDRQEELTYQELSDRVNQLATFLNKLGIKKGDLVGIYQARNINFLISILAILKAGGAYVPLDCTYPPERIKYMLVNSEVKILLTQSSLLDMFADDLEDYRHLQHIICLDTNDLSDNKLKGINLYSQVDIDRCKSKNIEDVVTGKDRAYTIYTSGSTGLPKGAIIRHDGAINHIYAQFDALKLQQGFSFLQSAPASSDISVWQFLAPILFGGKTVIADKETICNPEQLFKLIKEEKLTLIELVPLVLSSLLDYVSQLSPQEKSLPNLQCMMITGEYVAVELVNRWLSIYPEIKVTNAYGPTEALDDITQYIITEPLPANQKTVAIGKPLANNNIYIVDSQMQLQPIGVPGEICVSGIGVGDGYWRNETKTNESFVTNPFVGTTPLNLPYKGRQYVPSPDRRGLGRGETSLLYKTGDLGRWLPNGNIEFLGRIDRQVKIRGFRLELGEIESILSQNSVVMSSVVIVREDTPGDKRLVAYLVCDRDNLTDELPTTLRNFLKAKLPEYAIPSTFVLLDALPLTPSGKVDRKGLPAPEIDRENGDKSNILPRTPVEEVIAGVWSQVLKTDCVSINDNFFDRGGH